MQITILIVDDIEANLISLEALLKEYDDNFNIILAKSGEEALEFSLTKKIDLIILDIQMPGMDGFEVAKFLKSNNNTKDIPIIFLTAAFKSEEFVRKGFELGAVDYLTKPVDENQLINRVSLYSKLIKEIEKNREKDTILYQQSKMAAMGEMLGNIAHQWRQPLSAISTAASGIKMRMNFGKISEDEIKEDLDSIVDFTQHLSQTIDDFRNFFKQQKEKEEFDIADAVEKDLNIVEASFRNNNIEIIKSFKPCKITTAKNEFTQAILNILNNAKDAIVQNQKDNGLLFITIRKEGNNAVIYIKDNGGGVSKDIKDKIFEPYFTTKHKSQGTGIGLYMTNKIIKSHLKGSIDVENCTYNYKGKSYTGAQFKISLPLK